MSARTLTVLSTGQTRCFDHEGHEIDCSGTGQDGEKQAGIAFPTPRFSVEGDLVWDTLTGLCWARDASLSEFPLMWQEAIAFVKEINAKKMLGHDDWRLPSRAELLSLLCYQQTRPPLPENHPFINLFAGWYWSSTTAAYQRSHAWYLDMAGGRMFYGGKDQSFMVWPVRGESTLVWRRQSGCFDSLGEIIACRDSGQDGSCSHPLILPQQRFTVHDKVMRDHWSGLEWSTCADLGKGAVTWSEALELVKNMEGDLSRPWRLPNINELESLVDYDYARPAVTPGTPLTELQETYWSSTTSVYETDWAWALYLEKGAIGVGQKKVRNFHIIAVR